MFGSDSIIEESALSVELDQVLHVVRAKRKYGFAGFTDQVHIVPQIGSFKLNHIE